MWWWLCVLCVVVGESPLSPEGRWSWETAVEVRETPRPQRAAGAALRGTLHVHSQEHSSLLALKLENVQLLVTRKNLNNELVPRPSVWDAWGALEWGAPTQGGVVTGLLLDPALPTYVHNVQRAITSLLQFQAKEGWFNETDVSGHCLVQYETLSPSVYRKIKRGCDGEGGGGGGGVVRRVTRVEAGAVRGEEVGTWGAVGHRAWGALTAQGGERYGGRDLAHTHTLLPLTLQADPEWDESLVKFEESEETLEEAVEAGGQWGEEVGGDGDLPSVRRWERAAGAAVNGGGEAALRHGGERGAAAAAALAAAGGRLWEDALREPEVHAGALRAGLAHVGGAGAAAAARGPRWLRAAAARVGAGGEAAARGEVRRCVEEGGGGQCAVPWLGALGPGALLALVEEGDVCLEALQALRRLATKDHQTIKADHIRRLHRIILIPKHPYPIEVQSETLDILFDVGEMKRVALGVVVAPVMSEEIWRALRERGEFELARYLRGRAWGRGEWWVTAGRSGGAVADVGGAGGWRGEIREDHVLRRGALRTAAVHVRLLGPEGAVPALTLRAWARGMETLVGGADDGEEEEEPCAGVAWEAEGAPREELELFRGTAGLAAAAWGASGEPAVVVRRGYWSAEWGRVRSVSGVWVRGAESVAGRGAVDGGAAVSLWGRTAAVSAGVRGAVSRRGRVAVRSPWVSLSARSSTRGAPRLDVSADIDFYEDIALCVKADLAPYNITVEWEVEGAGRSLRRREEVVGGTGRTLYLDPALSAHCH